MDTLTPTGFLAALSEVSARITERDEERASVGVVALYAQPDTTFYRLPLEHLRDLGREIGGRISACLRPRDTVFQVDGKEWLISLPGVASAGVLTLAMLKLERAFSEHPVRLDGVALPLRVVCGAALSPDHGRDAFHLVQSARIAGLVAGRSDRTSLVYEASMERSAPTCATLERELREAFAGGHEPELHLQPKLHVASGQCRGAEGLLRWKGSDGVWVPPPVVIGLIDRFGMRHRFNRWLFHRAAQIMSELRAEGFALDLSINLSATDLYDAEVPDLIRQALETWRVPAEGLVLEITETSMVDESAGANVTRVFQRLRELGVNFSIDDFGTGFSGMSRLRYFAVQEVKIDRSFVTDLATSPRDREIASSIVDLSHRLGIVVTAEGVENAQTAALLAELGCDHLQGFHFSRAIPLPEFVRWLQDRVGAAPMIAKLPKG